MLLAVVAVLWLPLAALTAAGGRARGQTWPQALLVGLVFPATWVAWYLHDEGVARSR